MQESPSAPYAITFAIMFAYNGSEFEGLERSKGQKSIENILLYTVGALQGQELESNVNISMMNISRASITEQGEHASRQIISLEMTGSPDLKAPTAEALNAKLPAGIHVFKVVEMTQGFSARRSCETRTFEFVFPTYVLAPPPEGTMYANPPIMDDDESFAYPSDMVIDAPAGGMFKTLMRGKQPVAGKGDESIASFNEFKAVPEQLPLKKKGFAHWFSKMLFGQKVPEKIKKQEEIDMAFQRTHPTVRRTLHRKDAPTISMEVPKKAGKSNANQAASVEDDTAFTEMGGFFSTLKRTMSTKRRKASFNNEASSSISPSEIKYFEPLDIPMDEAYLSNLASYRITESQIKTLKTIISLYNGTHNWHNYIPGASANDSRCYLRILNVELSAPEMHDGLEWVRVKVQAKAFARYQIRKMIALAIMVIHTNTPVSVIGNSFGYAKIEFPEAPGLGLILDEPHYTQFNDQAIRANSGLIDFETIKDEVENFRKTQIHNKIYIHEAKNMEFAKWIRNMDMHSFLYTYFLNDRGVIGHNLNAVKK